MTRNGWRFWREWDDENRERTLPFWLRRDVALSLLIVVIGLALYLPSLGSYALWDPWEPHYSQVAMEMNDAGDSLVPHYRNGNRWFSKPILPLWLYKTSFQVFGQSEFTARLPIVLVSLFGLLAFNFVALRLFDWRTGWLATLVLMTSPQWFFIARQAIFDMPYVVFQTTAFGCLLLGLHTDSKRSRWIYAFWAFSALAMLSKGLLAVVLPASVVGGYIFISWDWSVLKRMRFGRGLLIFFALAAPWFVFMTAKFGMSYAKEFFIYHHFERAAGLIKKPNNTFDLYVQQIFYATFPWSALFPMAVLRFLSWRSADLIGKGRRYLMVFLCFAMPYIFFSLSSTKFNHYIFPVVPFMALIIGAYLARLLTSPQKSEYRLEALLALFIFIILAKDLVTHYKHLIHLFIYYYDRALPTSVNPRPYLYAFFIPMGVALGWPLVRRKMGWVSLTGLMVAAMAFTLFCNTWLLPRLADTFSQKMLWQAYQEAATNDEPVCEYHSWERRSVSYYFKNKSVYLNSRKQGTTKRFFARPGKLFCMVDRNVYSKLRDRVKKENQRELYIVNSDHPFTYLVATEKPEGIPEKSKGVVLDQVPIIPQPMKAQWEDKIQLLGWASDKESYRPGESVTLTFYFKVLQSVSDDYSIFIHGDAPLGGGRLNGDHTPGKGYYPTDRWKPGQIIQDVWQGRIPHNMSNGRMELFIGFFKGPQRLQVTVGPNDGTDRVKVGRLAIKG